MEEQIEIDIVDHQIRAHRNHHHKPHWYLDAEVKGTLKGQQTHHGSLQSESN